MQAFASMSSKKTSTITFRIDEKYEKALRKESEKKKISLNVLANQIFGEYTEFQQSMKKFGTIHMSKNALNLILESLDEKKVIELATQIGSKEPKDFILFKWKQVDSEKIAEFIQMYFEYCGYGVCEIEKEEQVNSLSVHHDLGKKGSVFLQYFLKALIQSTLEIEPDIVITENSISMKF